MRTLIMLPYRIMLLHFFWTNFAIGIILYFGTTKTRTIEQGLELKLELEVEQIA